MIQNSNFFAMETAPARMELESWVQQIATYCNAFNIHWCDGSKAEYDSLCEVLVKKGTFIKLNETKRPGSFACFSDPSDVARVEDKTFICSLRKEDAGPTNNWMDPIEMKAKLENLLKGAMEGRTLYVIPFCMGPLGSPYAKYGVQLTDSEYVVVNTKIMTRMGADVMPYLKNKEYVKCLHSVAAPLVHNT